MGARGRGHKKSKPRNEVICLDFVFSPVGQNCFFDYLCIFTSIFVCFYGSLEANPMSNDMKNMTFSVPEHLCV